MKVSSVIRLWVEKGKATAAKAALQEIFNMDPPMMNTDDLEVLYRADDVLQKYAIERIRQLEDLADKQVKNAT